MTIECYRHLFHALENGAAVLATVVAVKGSVPRELGAKMVICPNGQIFNTIGGGAGEAKVIRQAMTVLETGEKQRLEIDLSGAPHRETQGICGGMMQVWLERWCGEAAIAIVQKILDQLKAGQSVTLVTPFDARQPYLLPANPTSDAVNAFTETIDPPPTLLIIGAGHVGIQLAKVADLIGFQVVVQDDRPEWANTQFYPQATLILNDSVDMAIGQLTSHDQLYAALVTRGYQYDLAGLAALLKRDLPCQYIGMIGSEKRVRQVFQAVKQAGISTAQLQSVYAPIGLDIGALTPEEIAISIGAELILVRRGGTGRSLSKLLRRESAN